MGWQKGSSEVVSRDGALEGLLASKCESVCTCRYAFLFFPFLIFFLPSCWCLPAQGNGEGIAPSSPVVKVEKSRRFFKWQPSHGFGEEGLDEYIRLPYQDA